MNHMKQKNHFELLKLFQTFKLFKPSNSSNLIFFVKISILFVRFACHLEKFTLHLMQIKTSNYENKLFASQQL